MSNKKILFAGYYGYKNLGDDMFGLVSIWGAKEYWKNQNTYLLSSQGPVSKDININYVLSTKKYFRGQLLLQNYFEMIKSSYIVLSGGSILHSKASLMSSRGFAYLLSKINLVKMGAIGVSLGPFKNELDYRFIESVLQNFKFLVLRDRASYAIACSMELPYKPILGSDLAFLLPKIENLSNIQSSTQKIIGISLCHYEGYIGGNIQNEKRREDAIYRVLNDLKEDNTIKFRFFVINGNVKTGDLDFSKMMIDKLSLGEEQYEFIDYKPDTIEAYKLIASCDLMYSIRLHGAIFAATANVPALLVEYHQKCIDYLDDIGVEAKWRIGDMDISVKDVTNTIKKLLEIPPSNFYPKRDKLIYRAERNFTNEKIFEEMI